MSIREELILFLRENGLAEERHGYGHATCEDVADHLLANFNITKKEN